MSDLNSRAVRVYVHNEVQEFLATFAELWNSKKIEDACLSYAKDAVYISTETSLVMRGRDAIVAHYNGNIAGYEGVDLSFKIVHLLFPSGDYCVRDKRLPNMVTACIEWEFIDDEIVLDSGFATEVYSRDRETGLLMSVLDVS